MQRRTGRQRQEERPPTFPQIVESIAERDDFPLHTILLICRDRIIRCNNPNACHQFRDHHDITNAWFVVYEQLQEQADNFFEFFMTGAPQTHVNTYAGLTPNLYCPLCFAIELFGPDIIHSFNGVIDCDILTRNANCR